MSHCGAATERLSDIMELIRINDKKLKIMLTSLDMKNYALDSDKMSCETEETRRAFRNILHDAGVRGGFDTSSEKIFIQLYPSRAGGCEMFVTRLDLAACAAAARGERTEEMEVAMEQTARTRECTVFSFERLSSLLRACALLCRADGERRGELRSSAYRDGEDTYYLIVEGDALRYREQAMRHALLGEFGAICDDAWLAIYLPEHAAVLCEDTAIPTLGALA